MEILSVDELIGHCNRVLEKHTSGTKVYQEHESMRHHLQVLRQYLKLELPLVRLKELIDSMKVNHIILTPFAVGQPVYVASDSLVKKVYVVEHIDIYDEDCPVYYCVNPDNPTGTALMEMKSAIPYSLPQRKRMRPRSGRRTSSDEVYLYRGVCP